MGLRILHLMINNKNERESCFKGFSSFQTGDFIVYLLHFLFLLHLLLLFLLLLRLSSSSSLFSSSLFSSSFILSFKQRENRKDVKSATRNKWSSHFYSLFLSFLSLSSDGIIVISLFSLLSSFSTVSSWPACLSIKWISIEYPVDRLSRLRRSSPIFFYCFTRCRQLTEKLAINILWLPDNR